MSKVRADNYSNRLGTGAPDFPDGLNVTGTAATFSGNVSIAGTLTYQDVESIDSIGIITAQQGIQVLANGLDITGFSTFNTGVSVTGVVTATSFSGSGANLTGIDAAPSFTGVASGSLTNGQAVALTDDGKVIAVSGAGVPVSVGSTAVYESAATHYNTPIYDSGNDRIVIGYYDAGNGNKLTAVVGVVTGANIHYGTPVAFNGSGAIRVLSGVYDSNAGKILFAYEDDDNSDKGAAVVATVDPSDNSISFGSKVIFDNDVIDYTSTTFDSVNNKVVIAFNSNVSAGAAIVGTISGTSVTFGSIATYESGNTAYNQIVFDESVGKCVIAYEDTGDSDRGKITTGTVSGTSISFGSLNVFEDGNIEEIDLVYDKNAKKSVVFYKDNENTDGNMHLKAIVAKVEGTNVFMGNSNILNEGSQNIYKACFIDGVNRIALINDAAEGDNKNNGRLTILETIPNTMSLNVISKHLWCENPGYYADIVHHPKQDNLFIAFRDNQNSYYGSGLVFQHETHHSTMTSGNFLGFSNAAYSNGDSAKIQLVGSIDDAQSGLTTGRKHFVQPSGGIGLTAYPTLQVEAGTAISATQILIR